jgi:DNA-binding transcriptional ArsR family regulator
VLTPTKLATARQLLDCGQLTRTEIARTIGVGRATLYRHLDADERKRRAS